MTVGWFFIGIVASGGKNFSAMGLAGASPFIAVSVATVGMQDMAVPIWHGFIGWLVFWMVINLAAASLLLVVSLARFDHCVGRITLRVPQRTRPAH
jgi:hypothetical protein